MDKSCMALHCHIYLPLLILLILIATTEQRVIAKKSTNDPSTIRILLVVVSSCSCSPGIRDIHVISNKTDHCSSVIIFNISLVHEIKKNHAQILKVQTFLQQTFLLSPTPTTMDISKNSFFIHQ